MSSAEQLSDPRVESAFAALFERHRRELQVHCYRMLGSFEESEDLVQETFLRAWRKRASFRPDGPSSFRAWLYRIATNACLDVLRGRPRRLVPQEVAAAGDPEPRRLRPRPIFRGCSRTRIGCWLDRPGEDEPDAVVVARETIELAFLAAIQHLPPRQRAVLILRDVLGWSAKDTASLLDASVASVNSALQRARATLQDRLPEQRTEWTRSSGPSEEERELLRRYVEAHEQADVDALAELLREDALPHDASAPHVVCGARCDRDRDAEGLRPRVRPAAKRRRRRQHPAGGRPLPAAAGRLGVPGAGVRRAADRGRTSR